MDGKRKLNVVIQVSSDSMGRGDFELGKRLMSSFFNVLPEAGVTPSAIIFFNTGVFLSSRGSGILELLQDLEKAGVTILSCGTCVEHFNLRDKQAVGKISNMYEITETMLNADKVIPL